MLSIVREAEELLRGEPSAASGPLRGRLVIRLVVAAVVCGTFYGAVMGSFGGMRPLQMLYSGLKVPMLLLVTFCLAIPSFFVLNTLLGLREDFARAVRSLLATQAAVGIVLASLAPYTAFWYGSTGQYTPSILFNGLMFAVASVTGHAVAWRHYRPLAARNRRHRVMLVTWIGLYAFVGIQMGWVLRPFIGDPDQPTQFFRPSSWGNAYVVVGRMIWQTLR